MNEFLPGVSESVSIISSIFIRLSFSIGEIFGSTPIFDPSHATNSIVLLLLEVCFPALTEILIITKLWLWLKHNININWLIQ